MMITTGGTRAASPKTSGPTRLSMERRNRITKPRSGAADQIAFCCRAISPTIVADANRQQDGMRQMKNWAEADPPDKGGIGHDDAEADQIPPQNRDDLR